MAYRQERFRRPRRETGGPNASDETPVVDVRPRPVGPLPPPVPPSESGDDRTRMLAAVVAAVVLALLLLALLMRLAGSRLQGESAASIADRAGALSTNDRGAGEATEDEPVVASQQPTASDPTASRAADATSPIAMPGTADARGHASTEGLEDSPLPPDADGIQPLAGNSGASSREAAFATPAGATFFGLDLRGKHLVFVIDQSTSMAGPKLEGAKRELLRSVRVLEDHQRFTVIFFSDFPLLDRRFRKATPSRATYAALDEWLVSIGPVGGTHPFEAMRMAHELRPDGIFLLSDGEFDAFDGQRTIELLRQPGTPPVHGISLEVDSDSLRLISTMTGGQYRQVAVP